MVNNAIIAKNLILEADIPFVIDIKKATNLKYQKVFLQSLSFRSQKMHNVCQEVIQHCGECLSVANEMFISTTVCMRTRIH